MSKATQQQSTRPAVAVLALEIEAGAAVVQLTPDGVFRARDGRPRALPGWRVTAELAERIVARLRGRKTRVVVDYEHQTLHAENNGQPAPAAGWIDPAQVRYEPGTGLVAPVEWTARAKAMIDAGEYKYLSPVLPYDPKTGDVLDLLQVALTNFPALDGMAPVSALSAHFDLDPPSNGGSTVDKTQLAKLLGLADDATEEQITTAITALKAAADEHAAALKAKDEELAALKTKVDTGKPDPGKFVSIDAFEAVKTELAALKSTQTDSEVDALVKQGMADGKLLAAQEEWARSLGKADIAALRAYLEKTPAIAALKGTQTGGKKPVDENGDVQLDDAQLAVCKQLGLDPKEYAKSIAA